MRTSRVLASTRIDELIIAPKDTRYDYARRLFGRPTQFTIFGCDLLKSYEAECLLSTPVLAKGTSHAHKKLNTTESAGPDALIPAFEGVSAYRHLDDLAAADGLRFYCRSARRLSPFRARTIKNVVNLFRAGFGSPLASRYLDLTKGPTGKASLLEDPTDSFRHVEREGIFVQPQEVCINDSSRVQHRPP